MKTTELEIPKVPTDRGRIFDMTEPIIRLEQMDAAEYAVSYTHLTLPTNWCV